MPSVTSKLSRPAETAERLVGAILCFFVLACGRNGTPDDEAGRYAASDTCAGCHVDIAASYRSVAMAQSFSRPSVADAIEDYTGNNRFTHAPSGFTYEMLIENGRFLQKRSAPGAHGRPFEREVTFAIGSGRHARSYLHLDASGELTEMPVTWYSRERAWGMSPGYDRADQPDFFRPVTYTCLFCHNGYPSVRPGSDDATAPQIFPPDLPSGIDCQRCHGPGARHVRLARSRTASLGEVRTSIVNPARLAPRRQMDICMQCHLETTSSGNWSGVVTFGRGVFSFRPGEDLASYMHHFDHPAGTGHDDKFEIAHQAYRLRQSACFRASDGRMTCTTCHDPHSRPADPVVHYASKCLACHAVKECGPASRRSSTAGEPVNCVPCHMPSRRTDDVVHVVMTDHLIRRDHPAPELLLAPRREKTEMYRGPVVFYRPEEAPEGPERDLLLGVASVLDEVDPKAGVALLEKSVARLDPKTPEAPFQLGLTLQAAGRLPEALAALEKAVSLAPRNARILLASGNALAAAGRQNEALARYERAIAARPDYPEALTNLGNLLARGGRFDEALVQYDHAIAIRPDDAQAHGNRGAVLARLGRAAEAEAELEEALRIRPGQPDASLSLAAVFLTRGDPIGAVELLEDGERRNPEHAQVKARIAWILATSPRADVRNGRESLERAAAAVRLTGRADARALDALAAALAETGRTSEAVRVSDEARRLAAASGQKDLAAAIDARRALYEKGLPYRETRP